MARAVTSSTAFGGGGRQAREIQPMAEINTTPLIDVMLVLLIMFIITVPMQTHEVEVALPRPGDGIVVDRVRNDLGMSANGTLSWNGQAITDSQLAGALAEVAASPVAPEVHFRPDAAARYERVDQVLAIAARSGASTFGFAGNEQYHDSF
jgi:biopolymer transport protein ExbD